MVAAARKSETFLALTRGPKLAPIYMFWVSTRTSWPPGSLSLSSARTGADPHARTEANIASTARAVFVPWTAVQPNCRNDPILLVSRSRALTCHLHMTASHCFNGFCLHLRGRRITEGSKLLGPGARPWHPVADAAIRNSQ